MLTPSPPGLRLKVAHLTAPDLRLLVTPLFVLAHQGHVLELAATGGAAQLLLVYMGSLVVHPQLRRVYIV